MAYQIKAVHGHYEAYDAKGRFLTSGDTESELLEELEEMTN